MVLPLPSATAVHDIGRYLKIHHDECKQCSELWAAAAVMLLQNACLNAQWPAVCLCHVRVMPPQCCHHAWWPRRSLGRPPGSSELRLALAKPIALRPIPLYQTCVIHSFRHGGLRVLTAPAAARPSHIDVEHVAIDWTKTVIKLPGNGPLHGRVPDHLTIYCDQYNML